MASQNVVLYHILTPFYKLHDLSSSIRVLMQRPVRRGRKSEIDPEIKVYTIWAWSAAIYKIPTKTDEFSTSSARKIAPILLSKRWRVSKLSNSYQNRRGSYKVALDYLLAFERFLFSFNNNRLTITNQSLKEFSQFVGDAIEVVHVNCNLIKYKNVSLLVTFVSSCLRNYFSYVKLTFMYSAGFKHKLVMNCK